MTIIDLNPKYKNDKTTKNIIAIKTSVIIILVVSFDLIWGLNSVNNFIYFLTSLTYISFKQDQCVTDKYMNNNNILNI